MGYQLEKDGTIQKTAREKTNKLGSAYFAKTRLGMPWHKSLTLVSLFQDLERDKAHVVGVVSFRGNWL